MGGQRLVDQAKPEAAFIGSIDHLDLRATAELWGTAI
jgi:hypothetical protein